MNDELQNVMFKILDMISILDEKLYNSISTEVLQVLISIAYTAVKNDGLTGDMLIQGTALIVLDMASQDTTTNISSKKIKDVSITMGSGYGVSKWKTLYDSLLNGDVDGIYALRYVGIG